MTPVLFAPALLAVIAGSLGGWLRRRLPPRAAVVWLTVLAVAAAAAVTWGLVLVVIGGMLGVPGILARLQWCERVLAVGHQAPAVVSAVAGALLAIGCIRVGLFELRWRRTLHAQAAAGGVQIVSTTEPLAFSVPTAGGTVVVSQGLLSRLTSAEQAALLAHEQCHLDRGHHRFLHAAGLAAALAPVVVPLSRHVRFATEREADEEAAVVVGNRVTVARAIAAAAIGPWAGEAALGLGDHAVVLRVRELLYPQHSAWLPAATVVGAALATVVVLPSSTLQLHHLLEFGAHVCGLD